MRSMETMFGIPDSPIVTVYAVYLCIWNGTVVLGNISDLVLENNLYIAFIAHVRGRSTYRR